MKDLIRKKVKLLILLGEAKNKMKDALGDCTETRLVESLSEAVTVAAKRAAAGDVVLLSPACSSFDMFKNYEERGELFRREVMGLEDRG